MKLCFLAPANNYHTQKWCNYFVKKGYEVHVISFINAKINGAKVHWIDSKAEYNHSDAKKMKYLAQRGKVKKLVKKISPDIIHVHYASSYGTVAAISGLNNYILSVWGSDIYEFPQKSFFHKMLLKFSLKRAKYLFSTSKAMAQEGRKYTKKSMKITPFGVDVNLFSPEAFCRNEKDGRFIIGTVKSLNPKYGIDYILRAVKIIRDTAPEIPISLRIAGAGSHEEEYRSLSNELGISDVVTWLGFIPQQEVAKEWANMDIAIVYSNSESFGVSAVEAQACGTPVIISDVPGLMEATSPEKTSVVVPGKNEQALAEEIIRLYNMPEKRKQMGKTGRDYVLKKFEINTCFEDVEEFYKQLADD